MLSRVANAAFWLSRYVERAENVARFIDVNYNLTLGEANSLGAQWGPLIYTTGDHSTFEQRYGKPSRDNVLQFLSFDEDNPNSIISCVSAARENARTIREIISSVVWEQLNQFYFMVRSASLTNLTFHQPSEFCERVRLASHLLIGAADATMSHDRAWHFSRLGRLLERADKTSRIVDVQYFLLLPDKSDVGSAMDVVRWSALLKSAGALEMYRRRHGKIVPTRVAEFLILDSEFPRSAHFCLMRAKDSLEKITGSLAGTYCKRSEQQLGRLCSRLDYASINDVIERGLHEFIDEFQTELNAIGDAIHEDFFISYRQRKILAESAMSQTQMS